MAESRFAWNPSIANTLSSAELDKYDLVPVPGLEEFVTNLESSRRIIVGPKGSGKSLALVKRARLIGFGEKRHMVQDNWPFVTRSTEMFSEVFDNAQLAELGRTAYWAGVWKLVTGTLIAIRRFRAGNFENSEQREHELRRMLVGAEGSDPNRDAFFSGVLETYPKGARVDFVAPAVRYLTRRAIHPRVLREWYQSVVMPILRRGCNVQTESPLIPTSMILDAFDEEVFYKVFSKSSPSSDATSGFQIWAAAQAGLIEATCELHNTYQGAYEVYCSVREEAVDWYCQPSQGQLGRGNIEPLMLTLTYTAQHLREIFNVNVAAMAPENLAIAEDNDFERRFWGTQDPWHPTIWAKESLLDCMIRHTFMRPRDLVMIGQEVAKIGKKERVAKAAVMEAINGAAVRVFDDYAKFAIPPLLPETLAKATLPLKSNVIYSAQLPRLREQAALPGGICPVHYLWELGLIGVPIRRLQNETQDRRPCALRFAYDGRAIRWIQDMQTGEFEWPEISTPRVIESSRISSSELPDADYYVLHPALLSKVISLRQSLPRQLNKQGAIDLNFVDRRLIVGEGLDCPEGLKKPTLRVRFLKGLEARISWTVGTEGSMQLSLGSGGAALVVSVLAAAAFSGFNHGISQESLLLQVDRLVERGGLPATLGNQMNKEGKLNSREYFKQRLFAVSSLSDASPFREARDLLKDNEAPFEVEGTRKQNLTFLAASKLNPSEIWIEFE